VEPVKTRLFIRRLFYHVLGTMTKVAFPPYVQKYVEQAIKWPGGMDD